MSYRVIVKILVSCYIVRHKLLIRYVTQFVLINLQFGEFQDPEWSFRYYRRQSIKEDSSRRKYIRNIDACLFI